MAVVSGTPPWLTIAHHGSQPDKSQQVQNCDNIKINYNLPRSNLSRSNLSRSNLSRSIFVLVSHTSHGDTGHTPYRKVPILVNYITVIGCGCVVPAVRDAFAFGHLAWDAQPADRTGRRDVVVVVVMVVAGRRDVVVVVVVVVAGRCDVIVVVIVVVAGRRDVVVIAAPWELHVRPSCPLRLVARRGTHDTQIAQVTPMSSDLRNPSVVRCPR
jgi:hypothetical protein